MINAQQHKLEINVDSKMEGFNNIQAADPDLINTQSSMKFSDSDAP